MMLNGSLKKLSLIIGCSFASLIMISMDDDQNTYPEKLSEYHFFIGDIKSQQPSEGVVPYVLSTPLFSDYAEKLRFVRIPKGKAAVYNDSTVFDFPVGTALIKTFFYPEDVRNAKKGRRLMETRVLLHESNGWVALPYVWNDDQSDAILEVAGDALNVSYTDAKGKKKSFVYNVPNVNQCKGCHNRSEKLLPIGPSARQLNHSIDYGMVFENQLVHWRSNDMIQGLGKAETLQPSVKWDDPLSGNVNSRARLWLDINCAHCHRSDGPAASTGLYLGWNEKDLHHLGVDKTPVAAGRGSGGYNFSIVPGKPEESILLFRLKSLDPGIMMPELGRSQIHQESIALLEEWIKKMPAKN